MARTYEVEITTTVQVIFTETVEADSADEAIELTKGLVVDAIEAKMSKAEVSVRHWGAPPPTVVDDDDRPET